MLLMETGLRCFLMIILIVAVEIKRAGCMNILSSRKQVSLQEGEKLSLNCTLSHTTKEAKGLTMFWSKKKMAQDCSPQTSLQELKLKRAGETEKEDTLKNHHTSMFLTIFQAKLADSGIYQCCATSQNPKIFLQGHHIFVTITEKGNNTQKELNYQGGSLSSHSERSFKIKEKIWGLMVAGLLALKGL